jgi:hypothetical protein
MDGVTAGWTVCLVVYEGTDGILDDGLKDLWADGWMFT